MNNGHSHVLLIETTSVTLESRKFHTPYSSACGPQNTPHDAPSESQCAKQIPRLEKPMQLRRRMTSLVNSVACRAPERRVRSRTFNRCHRAVPGD